jgi:ribonucleoside-diphosphate reductase alpha chain
MFSNNAIKLIQDRYAQKGETPEGVFRRVAKALAIRDEKFEKELYDAMINGVFLPNSPCIRNAGRKKGSLSACFVLPIEDSVASIYQTLTNMAIIFQRGGGVGINFSALRPEGFPLSTGGTASGPVSFMTVFDINTNVIKQGGFRRGAGLLALNYDHIDIEKFCQAKLRGELTNANLSVVVADKFMKKAIKNGGSGKIDLVYEGKSYKQVQASNILDLIAYGSWVRGDPGILFYDRINRDNKLSGKVEIITTNPCVSGSTLVLTKQGYIRIDELVDKSIEIWNGFEFSEVTPRITGYNREIMSISFSDGCALNCTRNHTFYLSNGEKVTAENLRIGDKLMKYKFPIIEGTDEDEFAYTKGFYSGDGWFDNNRFTNFITLYGKKKECADHIKYVSIRQNSGKRVVLRLPHQIEFKKDFVPNINYSIKSRLDWLAGLLDSDGTKNSREGSLAVHSINKDFLWKIKLMLNTLGVQGIIGKGKSGGKRKLPGGLYNTQDCYRLTIKASSVRDLINLGLITQRIELNPTNTRDAGRFTTVKNIKQLSNLDTVYCFTEPKRHTACFNGVITGQCGEVPLPSYAACVLGSINISKFVEGNKFNFEKFGEAVRLGSRALAHVNIINWYPLDAIRRTMEELQPQGLGIMGFADTLIQLGIYYDSEDCLNFIDELGKVYVKESDAIAPHAFYKRSIAPTGSLSILADCSASIEPIFYRKYQREVVAGTFVEGKEIYKSQYCKTALEITPEWHIKIQSRFQKYVDAGVSKSINCPEETTVQDIKKLYILAWKSGCKGITIFRNKSIEGVYKPIESKCEDGTCHL